eukprot:3138458-Prymnesium_polylepis.1
MLASRLHTRSCADEGAAQGDGGARGGLHGRGQHARPPPQAGLPHVRQVAAAAEATRALHAPAAAGLQPEEACRGAPRGHRGPATSAQAPGDHGPAKR